MWRTIPNCPIAGGFPSCAQEPEGKHSESGVMSTQNPWVVILRSGDPSGKRKTINHHNQGPTSCMTGSILWLSSVVREGVTVTVEPDTGVDQGPRLLTVLSTTGHEPCTGSLQPRGGFLFDSDFNQFRFCGFLGLR